MRWPLDELSVTKNTTILCSSSVVGVTIGSMLGGKFIKNGRRRMIMIYSIIAIIGSLLSCAKDWEILIAGRVIYGFSSGIFFIAASKILSETVPTNILDKGYGVSTNLSINVFFVFGYGLGSWVPKTEEGL